MEENKMVDEQIIDLLTARDESGLETAQKQYGALIKRIGLNALQDESDAEECASDVLLALWNNIPPERPNPLISYICKIARNLALKKLAYNRADKRYAPYGGCLEELEEVLESKAEGPAEIIEAAELTEYLNNFLEDLPKTDRIIFVRRYWFNDPYDEIAKLTGLTVKNVSVKLTRIREKLRRFLIENQMISK